MLGWEFPPFISGGLGTACYGLTRAMSKLGAEVLFVLPKAVDAEHSGHVRLLSPDRAAQPRRAGGGPTPRVSANGQVAADEPPFDTALPPELEQYATADEFEHVTFKTVPAWLTSPYQTPADYLERREYYDRLRRQYAEYLAEAGSALPGTRGAAQPDARDAAEAEAAAQATGLRTAQATDYAGDIISEVQRYAAMCQRLTRGERFDVIHAHDWMTYPAGMAIAALTGKPLVVHVHSTEFDRAGESIHTQIYEIERRGMHAATRVICVSHLTRKICEHRYSVPPEKIGVVYNGIEQPEGDEQHPVQPLTTIRRGDKIVLFLGRLTMQKGPEYFVAAAKKVLQKYDDVKFIVAGSGDMARRTIELAAEMGIGHKVLFTGFLRGKDVERVFQMADVYVMPSVSEPFGIAPLEAIRHDVPVIISKNSGVAEVISHALKVDFWDVDEMANKIIAVLKHPPLSQTLREHADFEVRKLTWEGAAERCLDLYRQALRDVPGPMTRADAPARPIHTR
jgi:glycosyltransferase involved in cell wall biosynthesis